MLSISPEVTAFPAERVRAEESLRLTMAWARRSLDHFRAHCHEVPWFNELTKDGVPQVPRIWFDDAEFAFAWSEQGFGFGGGGVLRTELALDFLGERPFARDHGFEAHVAHGGGGD